MDQIVKITLNDGLMLPSGFVSPATYVCNIFCKVPAEWTGDNALKTEHEEAVLEYLYGKKFRDGNEDGSRYVYRNFRSQVLTPAEVESGEWRTATNTKEQHFWHCVATPNGELVRANASDL